MYVFFTIRKQLRLLQRIHFFLLFYMMYGFIGLTHRFNLRGNEM